MSEEALQIAEKRREAKGKGDKERYTHLNAEFQRIMRNKKAFLSLQCKETEESKTMGKTRDLFKKIGAIKGIFNARMGIIMYRNGKGLTEAEETKKWWQEYTELYKKGLNDPDSHNGVVIHLEPDTLACEVKWALGSIAMNKARGDDEIPADKILKDAAAKVLHSVSENMENSAVTTVLEKVSFHSSPKEGQCQRMFNLPYNCAHFTC